MRVGRSFRGCSASTSSSHSDAGRWRRRNLRLACVIGAWAGGTGAGRTRRAVMWMMNLRRTRYSGRGAVPMSSAEDVGCSRTRDSHGCLARRSWADRRQIRTGLAFGTHASTNKRLNNNPSAKLHRAKSLSAIYSVSELHCTARKATILCTLPCCVNVVNILQ